MRDVGTGDCPRRLRTVVEQNLWEEALLYSPGTNMAFVLNESAKAIWNLCDGTRTTFEIIHELAKRFNCPADPISSDVRRAIVQLVRVGLLEIDNTPYEDPYKP